MATAPAIAFERVCKGWGAQPVLRDINLAFASGRITAIVGRSGCGKSTLLRLCNGLLTPDAGTVRVFGEPLPAPDPVALRRRIGYAVQQAALFPHLTGEENITLVARLEGWSAAALAERLEKLRVLVDLPADALARLPFELSGGQQQRVGLCRALFLHPAMLLLDEPFAAVDPLTRRDIHRRLLAVHAQEPVTTVLVTHDMAEALHLAEEVVILGAAGGPQVHSREALRARQGDGDAESLLLTLMGEADP
ncbi:ATP-binding cassette domain-containing protein [Pseudohaliea rubra]|uniref:Pyrimidine ABC transporter, ATP-binding protein n=1 Tax=Pseudohaliea rubra DSM 19751 TaxID=1265313 RepID=A0A095VNB4_9GAMM|nr:ATP-binding cassette domain-containing protein [Pseudohaliea rubra]KGE02573.1 Pyrimidine ABC transporter, ATP-binding protein [Pseudohaliea rubra DSM 19751]